MAADCELKMRDRFCIHGHDINVVGRTCSANCKACVAIYQKVYRSKKMEELKAYRKQYYIENKLSIDAKNKENYRKNTRQYILRAKLWAEKHREQSKALASHKEARRRQRKVTFGQEGIADFYRNRPIGYHVDHIIPLNGKTVSGLHVIWNLQYLRVADNLRKHNAFPYAVEVH